MQAMTRLRSAMLGVLVSGFGGAWMTGACVAGEPSAPVCPASGVEPPETPEDTATECPAPVEKPCMRYRIPLLGNPSLDVALRNKYKAAFGDACYMSVSDTFDCFYKTPQKACEDAVKIAEVYGAVPYEKHPTTCLKVGGTEDYSLQVGPDVANKIYINYQDAPRETPLIEIDGVPTEVNGPYRNLTEPQKLTPGEDFYCDTVDNNGAKIEQRKLILQVNSKAHGGEIHSDLAGFTYPCRKGCPEICTERLVLKAGPKGDPDAAQVHHVVRRKDLRGCDWGTNSNKNAAVISRKLNRYLTNNYPSADEVKQINKVAPYMP